MENLTQDGKQQLNITELRKNKSEDLKIRQKISERLYKRLLELNMSQRQLAIKLNQSPANICRTINGKTVPDIITLIRIAKALGLTVTELIGE